MKCITLNSDPDSYRRIDMLTQQNIASVSRLIRKFMRELLKWHLSNDFPGVPRAIKGL